MLISELITFLEGVKSGYGDLPVTRAKADDVYDEIRATYVMGGEHYRGGRYVMSTEATEDPKLIVVID